MSDYYDFGQDSCNLPSYCECSQCKYWEENGCDVNRDPVWLDRSKEDEDDH